MSQSGAQLLIKSLEILKVKYIFGIPGAKIDAVFDAIQDSSIKLIVCRHEQNACFMAAAHGRLTGEPGVVLVTSGPGVGNMLTGLLTATTEDDPVVAIGGNVCRLMLHKASHQRAQNVKLMEAATKSFGAKGYLLDDSTKFEAIMRKALSDDGPVLVHMPVDYRDSMDLFINTDPNAGH